MSGNFYFEEIISRAARLVCTEEEFAALWNDIYCSNWNKLSVKDGGTSMLDDWKTLSPSWQKLCGVYGWTKIICRL